MPRLLWWLIYRCTAALPNPAEMPPRPYHADGGAYHLMGFAREPENRHYLAWDYNGPMYNDGFRWFGLQHFGNSPVQDLFELNQPHMGKLCALLIRLIQADFDPSCVTADEQELLAELLTALTQNDLPMLQGLESRLTVLEQGVLADDTDKFIHKMSAIRRELNRENRFYAQLGDFAETMQEDAAELLGHRAQRRVGYFARRVGTLRSETQMLREYATQISGEYQAQVDILQNRVMKLLTIVTTIFLPLSLIVGWYGMNFAGMPELGWKYGYPAVITVSVLIVAGLIWYFKRKKWL